MARTVLILAYTCSSFVLENKMLYGTSVSSSTSLIATFRGLVEPLFLLQASTKKF